MAIINQWIKQNLYIPSASRSGRVTTVINGITPFQGVAPEENIMQLT